MSDLNSATNILAKTLIEKLDLNSVIGQIQSELKEKYDTQLEVERKIIQELKEQNNVISKNLSELEEELVNLNSVKSKVEELEQTNSDLQSEIDTYGNVSIVKNFNKQIFEKDNEIKILTRKIKQLEENNVNEVEIEVEGGDNEVVENDDNGVENDDNGVVENEVVENDNSLEPAAVEQVESDEEEEEEDEIEVIEKKLRHKIYYVTDDDDKYIYEKLDDGSIGDCVGKYNSKNRPHFYKK